MSDVIDNGMLLHSRDLGVNATKIRCAKKSIAFSVWLSGYLACLIQLHATEYVSSDRIAVRVTDIRTLGQQEDMVNAGNHHISSFVCFMNI